MKGLFTNDLFLEHDTGTHHPENAGRLVAIENRLDRTGLTGKFQKIRDRFATVDEVALNHERSYIAALRALSERDGGFLDGDTPVSSHSYQAALLAAGAGLQAADDIRAGTIDRALLLVRPPGHHSLRTRGMGFCLFNNIAVTAKYCQQIGFPKVAILDWDVHHGNGTEASFYDDPSVLFVSLHQYPFYPGTGAAGDTGRGAGTGFTLNVPMRAGSGDADYRHAFRESVLPKMESFAPDIVLISAGFDAHEDDPLAQINLPTVSFEWMTRDVVDLAGKMCGGRIISFLEGGYNLEALAESVEVHASGLL